MVLALAVVVVAAVDFQLRDKKQDADSRVNRSRHLFFGWDTHIHKAGGLSTDDVTSYLWSLSGISYYIFVLVRTY